MFFWNVLAPMPELPTSGLITIRWRVPLAILWTLGILAACSIPGRDLPRLDLLEIDKLAHFSIFAGLGWLWMAALRTPREVRTARVLVAGFCYAVLTEIYQGFLPFERTPDPLDALANAAGLSVSVWLYRRFFL